jgi:hypothetical protein
LWTVHEHRPHQQLVEHNFAHGNFRELDGVFGKRVFPSVEALWEARIEQVDNQGVDLENRLEERLCAGRIRLKLVSRSCLENSVKVRRTALRVELTDTLILLDGYFFAFLSPARCWLLTAGRHGGDVAISLSLGNLFARRVEKPAEVLDLWRDGQRQVTCHS